MPGPVRCAALLTAIEAVGLAIGCALFLQATLTGEPSDRRSALLSAGMGLGLAALLGVWARGLLRGRRFALTPVVLIQLFLLPLSWGMHQSGRELVAVGLATVSVAVLVLLFGNDAARRAFS